jgi:hypothetical protein
MKISKYLNRILFILTLAFCQSLFSIPVSADDPEPSAAEASEDHFVEADNSGHGDTGGSTQEEVEPKQSPSQEASPGETNIQTEEKQNND